MKKHFFLIAFLAFAFATSAIAQNKLFHPEQTFLLSDGSWGGVTGFKQEYTASCLAVANWKQHTYGKLGVFAYAKGQLVGENLGMIQFQVGPQFSYVRKKMFLTTGAGIGFGSLRGGLAQPRLAGYFVGQTKPLTKSMKGADEVYARIEIGQGAPVIHAGICHYVINEFAIGMAYRSDLHFPGPELRFMLPTGLQLTATGSASARVKQLTDADLRRFKGSMWAWQFTLRQSINASNDHKTSQRKVRRVNTSGCPSAW